MPPLKKGAYCLQLSVCRSVGLSVCRPSVVRSISFDPFTWSIPHLVQGLPSVSRWSLLIFRSHVQRSRSNHSFELSVLSAIYLLKIFFSRTAGPISTQLGTDHPLVKGTQGLTNKDHSVIKKEMFVFSSPNQCYDIIIALSKCVYWFDLVSQVSNVTHGPLVIWLLKINCGVNMVIMLMPNLFMSTVSMILMLTFVDFCTR